MKNKMLLASLFVSGVAAAQGVEYVPGYMRSDGAYAPPHYRTKPDSNVWNNWSTQGNTNPYTGQNGTVNPYRPPPQPNPYTYQPARPAQPFPTYPAYQPYRSYFR